MTKVIDNIYKNGVTKSAADGNKKYKICKSIPVLKKNL